MIEVTRLRCRTLSYRGKCFVFAGKVSYIILSLIGYGEIEHFKNGIWPVAEYNTGMLFKVCSGSRKESSHQ